MVEGNVEYIIKEIITIDKNAENIKKEKEEFLQAEKDKIKDTLAAMHKQSDININTMKKQIMDQKLKEVDISIEKVRVEKELAIKKIKASYEKEKEGIVQEALQQLINSSFKEE